MYGVASGDPLTDRVIIWTRVTPADLGANAVSVHWKIATDTAMTTIVNSGTSRTKTELYCKSG
jgi:alkaline phosphatase D